MVTIVAGIIIDTFGLLRDNENSKLKDMERICFICGLNKEIFERQVDLKKGFSIHILVNLNHFFKKIEISFLFNKNLERAFSMELCLFLSVLKRQRFW